MTDRELLKHVFNAWEDHWTSDLQSELLEEIRIRLSQCERCGEKNPAEIHTCTPINKEWQGLTEDEIAQLMFKCDVIVTGPTQFDFANAIEAKLKDKNT